MSTQYQRKRFEIYKLWKSGFYYWLLIASNGRIVLRSNRNFKTKNECRNNIKLIRRITALAGVVDREA